MTDLAQLIAKLEAASEGSRELDAAMFRAIGAPLPDKFANLNLELTWGPDGSAYMPVGEMQVRYEPPAYTTSLDAIVALIERKLPGWTLARLGQNDDKTWYAELREGYLTSYDRVASSSYRPGSRPATPALALCIAFLRALQAQQETSEDE